MSGPTHVVISTASVAEVAASIGEQAPVGRLDAYTVAALGLQITAWPTPAAERVSKSTSGRVFGILDTGNAVGVGTAVDGNSAFLLWVEGWDVPQGRAFDRFVKGWRQTAGHVAALAGRPEVAGALGDLLDVPDAHGVRPGLGPMLGGAMQILDLPFEVLGTSAQDPSALTEVVIGEPARKKGLFGFRR